MALWPTTVRARLTLWYTLVLSVPLVGFATISYIAFSRTLLSRTDGFLNDALTAFSTELSAERRTYPRLTDATRVTATEVRFRDLEIAILDSTFAVIAIGSSQQSLGADSATIFHADVQRALRESASGAHWLTVHVGGVGRRVVVRPAESAGHRYYLIGDYPLAEVDGTLARIRTLFLVLIPLLIVAAATGGYFLAKRSLSPVAAMATRAAEISASTLHERLPVGGVDELGGLARVLNALLDRLERSFEQQRRFMADASHELRTPTAIVRTEADVTLAREHRTEEEYRHSVTIMQDAARRLTRIVDDLFLAARSDAGQSVMQPAQIYLEDIVDAAIRGVRPLADRRGVRVEVTSVIEAPILGDADLLGRVVLNLLDNAIKHSPTGAAVTIGLERRGDRYVIAVDDSGVGIPPEEAERIFERFVRLDRTRAAADGTSGGAGLGLGIARKIAELHGGTVVLVSSRPGHTRFEVRLLGRTY